MFFIATPGNPLPRLSSYTESGATIINDVHARSNHITTAISPPQLQPPGRVWESLQQMSWQETLQR